MKKAIACLLALPLMLVACGAQGTSAAPEPEISTEATAETAPEETAPAAGPAGRLRCMAEMAATDTGLYTVKTAWNENTNVTTFYFLRTEYDTAVQQKVAELELAGDMYIGMAVWDDTAELFVFENAGQPDHVEYCCTVDLATGSMERRTLDNDFWPGWYDDAAVYEVDYGSGVGAQITRRECTTGEISDIPLPQQTRGIYSVGTQWLIDRIVSPSPLPSEDEWDMYEAVLQNSETELDLLDPATGELQKLYSYPAAGDAEYFYLGQRDDVLYFQHWKKDENGSSYLASMDKLENGEMVQVLAVDTPYDTWYPLEDAQGELQWLVRNDITSADVYDLNDGQTHSPAFQSQTGRAFSIGYPELLLPGGKVLVTYGSAENTAYDDKGAYAIIDRDAYFAGSTDYTPITMYTGE